MEQQRNLASRCGQYFILKRRFPTILSDADFEFKEGERESMLNGLSGKLKKTRQELEMLFAELQTY